MEVGFSIDIALEHTAIAKKVNVAMESVIGRQKGALIQLGPYQS